MASLADVMIDDLTWRYATRPRRAEWQQAITELIEEASFQGAGADGAPAGLVAYITIYKQGISVGVSDPSGHQIGTLDLPEDVIAPLFKEYMGIIREMVKSSRGSHSPQLEALDIAKRLTHDDGAEVVQRLFRDVRPDHGTARRLFTLLVLLTHDTTRLAVPKRG